MSSFGDVGTSSFDAYEGIRILIPGAFTFALSLLVVHTIDPELAGRIRSDAVLSLIASLLIGLVLYYWDFPAKAAAALQEQPTSWLEKKYPEKNPQQLTTAYLEILNTLVPATIRNRALYMGSMYRIGLELIVALSTSSVVVVAVSQWVTGPTVRGVYLSSPRLWAVASIICTFIFSFVIGVGYQRKSDYKTRRTSSSLALGSMRSITHRSIWIFVAGLALMLISAVINDLALAGTPLLGQLTGTGALVLCYGYWLIRYVRGDKCDSADPRKREPMAAPASAFLMVIPLLCSLLLGNPAAAGPLSGLQSLFGWSLIISVAVLSVTLRGHERKLRGSYIGQTRWLEHNVDLYEHLIVAKASDSARRNVRRLRIGGTGKRGSRRSW